ncbi:MAG TPA: hypothetical protein VFP61_12045, partial [Acidimicrobiales bacterium]|nr:hypothetical protein [Acidimicrobiales bacterium]
MDVIDVTVVGGPDVAAVVDRSGPLLRVSLRAGGSVPARVERVAVVVETAPVHRVTAPPWAPDEPGFDGRLAGTDVRGPWAATDQGCVAWLGAAAHRGEVVVKADGWLVTAWADLGGLVLGPGESIVLDPLWVGGDLPDAVGAWAEVARPVAAPAGPRPLAHRAVAVVDPLGPLPADGVAATTEVDALASLAAAAPGRAGVVVDPWPADADLSRPGAVATVTALGASLAAAGACWVVVRGARRLLAAGTAERRWGASSSTPVADLRAGMLALRAGLGPGPVLHLAEAPPATGSGVADVVDTGPGAAPLWAPLDGAVWHAAGPPPAGGTTA